MAMKNSNNNDLNILIVEDEELYRLKLEAFILELGHTIVASIDNSEEAIELINQEKPDMVIMDININGKLDGIQVAEKFNHTHTIFLFITSFNERKKYERAKQTAFIGYLVKPFDLLTLQSTIEYSQVKKTNLPEEETTTKFTSKKEEKNSILIKHNTQLYKVFYSNILYIEAKGKFSIVNTIEKTLVSNTSLSKFVTKLPQHSFIQIHKSYIVNINQITKVISKNNELFIGDNVLPIGRVYKEKFLKHFDIF